MENLIAFNNEFPYISDGSIAYFFEHQGYPDSPTRGHHTGHQQPLAKMPKELTCEGRACAKESKIFFRDFLWTTRQKVHL